MFLLIFSFLSPVFPQGHQAASADGLQPPETQSVWGDSGGSPVQSRQRPPGPTLRTLKAGRSKTQRLRSTRSSSSSSFKLPPHLSLSVCYWSCFSVVLVLSLIGTSSMIFFVKGRCLIKYFYIFKLFPSSVCCFECDTMRWKQGAVLHMENI